MSPEHLDQLYAELANALQRVGQDKAQLMLATLSLALIAKSEDLAWTREKILQAERLASL